MSLPVRDRVQALVDPREPFTVGSPLGADELTAELAGALRERRSRLRGRPGRLVYLPEAYMTPIRPVLEGTVAPAVEGSVIAGTARLSWAVRIGAAVLFAYLLVYGVAGVVYALATAQAIAAVSVLSFAALWGCVRVLGFLSRREYRRAIAELERVARGQATPQR